MIFIIALVLKNIQREKKITDIFLKNISNFIYFGHFYANFYSHKRRMKNKLSENRGKKKYVTKKKIVKIKTINIKILEHIYWNN